MLYINKKHSHRTCLDLAIYKPKKLNPFLLKLFYPKKSNLIVGSICKCLYINICTFNDHQFKALLDNLFKDVDETIVLLGDLNMDLLNFDISDMSVPF